MTQILISFLDYEYLLRENNCITTAKLSKMFEVGDIVEVCHKFIMEDNRSKGFIKVRVDRISCLVGYDSEGECLAIMGLSRVLE
jgi:hypothetical protein